MKVVLSLDLLDHVRRSVEVFGLPRRVFLLKNVSVRNGRIELPEDAQPLSYMNPEELITKLEQYRNEFNYVLLEW